MVKSVKNSKINGRGATFRSLGAFLGFLRRECIAIIVPESIICGSKSRLRWYFWLSKGFNGFLKSLLKVKILISGLNEGVWGLYIFFMSRKICNQSVVLRWYFE